jgi:kanamycin nucleotidyltransferase
MLINGPLPQTRSTRLDLVQQYSARLQAMYGDQIVAIALYGSMAREQDGPHSDIEMFCVLNKPDSDINLEWVYGGGKAEINILGRNDARWEAREVCESWALTQGTYLNAKLVFGDPACLQELSDLVMALSETEIAHVVEMAMVGELYEWIGKARNALQTGHYGGMAALACKFAEIVAMLLGLARRTCYSTGSRMLDESLQFAELPAGYEGLCNLVRHGDLSNPQDVIMAMEETWKGMVDWTIQMKIHVTVDPWPFAEE